MAIDRMRRLEKVVTMAENELMKLKDNLKLTHRLPGETPAHSKPTNDILKKLPYLESMFNRVLATGLNQDSNTSLTGGSSEEYLRTISERTEVDLSSEPLVFNVNLVPCKNCAPKAPCECCKPCNSCARSVKPCCTSSKSIGLTPCESSKKKEMLIPVATTSCKSCKSIKYVPPKRKFSITRKRTPPKKPDPPSVSLVPEVIIKPKQEPVKKPEPVKPKPEPPKPRPKPGEVKPEPAKPKLEPKPVEVKAEPPKPKPKLVEHKPDPPKPKPKPPEIKPDPPKPKPKPPEVKSDPPKPKPKPVEVIKPEPPKPKAKRPDSPRPPKPEVKTVPDSPKPKPKPPKVILKPDLPKPKPKPSEPVLQPIEVGKPQKCRPAPCNFPGPFLCSTERVPEYRVPRCGGPSLSILSNFNRSLTSQPKLPCRYNSVCSTNRVPCTTRSAHSGTSRSTNTCLEAHPICSSMIQIAKKVMKDINSLTITDSCNHLQFNCCDRDSVLKPSKIEVYIANDTNTGSKCPCTGTATTQMRDDPFENVAGLTNTIRTCCRPPCQCGLSNDTKRCNLRQVCNPVMTLNSARTSRDFGASTSDEMRQERRKVIIEKCKKQTLPGVSIEKRLVLEKVLNLDVNQSNSKSKNNLNTFYESHSQLAKNSHDPCTTPVSRSSNLKNKNESVCGVPTCVSKTPSEVGGEEKKIGRCKKRSECVLDCSSQNCHQAQQTKVHTSNTASSPRSSAGKCDICVQHQPNRKHCARTIITADIPPCNKPAKKLTISQDAITTIMYKRELASTTDVQSDASVCGPKQVKSMPNNCAPLESEACFCKRPKTPNNCDCLKCGKENAPPKPKCDCADEKAKNPSDTCSNDLCVPSESCDTCPASKKCCAKSRRNEKLKQETKRRKEMEESGSDTCSNDLCVPSKSCDTCPASKKCCAKSRKNEKLKQETKRRKEMEESGSDTCSNEICVPSKSCDTCKAKKKCCAKSKRNEKSKQEAKRRKAMEEEGSETCSNEICVPSESCDTCKASKKCCAKSRRKEKLKQEAKRRREMEKRQHYQCPGGPSCAHHQSGKSLPSTDSYPNKECKNLKSKEPSGNAVSLMVCPAKHNKPKRADCSYTREKHPDTPEKVGCCKGKNKKKKKKRKCIICMESQCESDTCASNMDSKKRPNQEPHGSKDKQLAKNRSASPTNFANSNSSTHTHRKDCQKKPYKSSSSPGSNKPGQYKKSPIKVAHCTIDDNTNSLREDYSNLLSIDNTLDNRISAKSEDMYVLVHDASAQAVLLEPDDIWKMPMSTSMLSECSNPYNGLSIDTINFDGGQNYSVDARLLHNIQTNPFDNNEAELERPDNRIPRKMENVELKRITRNNKEFYDYLVASTSKQSKLKQFEITSSTLTNIRSKKTDIGIPSPKSKDSTSKVKHFDWKTIRHKRFLRGSTKKQRVPETLPDQDTPSPQGTTSEGEVDCNCSISLGEVHNCEPKLKPKSLFETIKSHKHDLGLRIAGRHRSLFNKNLVSYYLSTSSSFNES